jgi:hypothetical protein
MQLIETNKIAQSHHSTYDLQISMQPHKYVIPLNIIGARVEQGSQTRKVYIKTRKGKA